MSESLDGLSVSATRQKPGRSAYGFPPRPRAGVGATNAPGATVCAIVIVVCGSESDDRLSHVAAPASVAVAMNTVAIVIVRNIGLAPRQKWCPAVARRACCG